MRAKDALAVIALVVTSVVVGVVVGGACSLPPPSFGRPCNDTHPCDPGYVCFTEACVSRGFPLLDAGVDAGGAGDDDAGASNDDAGAPDAG